MFASVFGFVNSLQLRAAERIAYSIALFAILIDLFLIYWKGAIIDWPAYSGLFLLSTMLFVLGYIYRIKGRSERIASALICTGGLIVFSMALSLFNYLLLPITQSPIDPYIADIDALFGFYWPDIMQWAAENPTINMILKLSYTTTMPQLSVLVALLGILGLHRDLHVLILSVVISATLAICFWGLFPTLGAKSLYDLPVETWMAVSPIVDLNYTNELKRIAVEGASFITPSEIRGLIAFPSYHASLAFIALISARNLKYLFPVFIVLNLLILPATFIHGGHHFLDPFAGFVLFWIAYKIATRVVDADHVNLNIPKIVPA